MKGIWIVTLSTVYTVATMSVVVLPTVPNEDPVYPTAEILIPVSEGTSVTVYERTGDYVINTYTLATLTGEGGKFSTVANEDYKITSDGTYLISDCYRPYYNGGGHNIAAVRLNGVDGYPEGIWSGEVVSYILGRDGISETRFNALGNHMENHTRLGDEDSQLVLAFYGEIQRIEADVSCGPKTLNLGSMGNWITCYIELPEGYDPRDIDASTILFNDALPPELDPKYGFAVDEDSYIMDHDEDGIEERMVKFDRWVVEELAPITDRWDITLTGKLKDGTDIVGRDWIRTIYPQAVYDS